ncbi:hypothetical protein C8Q75DRAFT_749126 [Abortiporus biennis]|nr:hypothetical protein C8Q75DRAFT_749126 [Abortiporus biennis]
MSDNIIPMNALHRDSAIMQHIMEEPLPISPRHILSMRNVQFPNGGTPGAGLNGPPIARKVTQRDQKKLDDDARKRVMSELTKSWMDRLQLISVMTTFFAAAEAQLLGITTPDDDPDAFSNLRQSEIVANASLTGALVIHVYAAILSFFASFFLVRYRLKEATPNEVNILSDKNEPVSTNPHLETVGLFRQGHAPFRLLEYCHSLCMLLTAIGFILALSGVICFAWARFPVAVSIFASICAGTCSLFSIIAVIAADVTWTYKPAPVS